MRSIIAFLAFGLTVTSALPAARSNPLVSIEINVPGNHSLAASDPAGDELFEQVDSDAGPSAQTRIVGGLATTISRYPMMAAVLRSTSGTNFRQWCGGSIINARTIITAAHCVRTEAASRFRFRVGSTNAHSGGRVHHVSRYRNHPNYRVGGFNADLSLLRSSTQISFISNVRAVGYAGPNYRLNVGTNVMAAGWGATRTGGNSVEALRHVQLQIMNHATCRQNYARHGLNVNNNMVCAGSMNGGRDQCSGDSGGPLLHNGVLVGLSSFGRQCGLRNFPGVNTRISVFGNWIRNNRFTS